MTIDQPIRSTYRELLLDVDVGMRTPNVRPTTSPRALLDDDELGTSRGGGSGAGSGAGCPLHFGHPCKAGGQQQQLAG